MRGLSKRYLSTGFFNGFSQNAIMACGLVFGLLLLSTGSWAESFSLGSFKADLVLIKKSERRLYLMCNGKAVRKYRISLGKNPTGSKQREGDKRTPEGKYILDWRNGHSKFYKSIHISYPNEKDMLSARSEGVNPGGMIMIHGIPDDPDYPEWLFEEIDWTDGCIAVNNRAMDEIWASVDEGTPIKITP